MSTLLFYKTLPLTLLLSLFLAGVWKPSIARAQGETSLFTPIQPLEAFDVPAPPQAAVRTRSVKINLDLLAGPQGDMGSQSLEGATVRMNLFDDTVYDVVIESIEKSASGGSAWNGRIAGSRAGYAYMVYTDGVFAAHLASPAGVYEVQYAGREIYTVSQLDQSLYPDDIVLERTLPADALPPAAADLSAQSITYIDVMVVYTARAVTALGGVSAMNARVDLAVQETNQSYINSNVDQRINLVYKGQVTYDEGANPDFGLTLNHVTGKADGHMDNVHALRDAYNADLVSLMIEGTQYCGIAWLMTAPSVSFESSAFSVVAQSCATGYYSFAHEMGHNMGSRHDTFVDSTNTPYPYSHGFTYPADNWRTIMAYNNACSAVGRNCTRLQYWSNPGVSYNGAAMGNAGSADNHFSLNNTAPTVAAFRTSPGFNKTSPSDGAADQLVDNLNLSWDTSAGAIEYELCYDTSNDNTCDGTWQDQGDVTGATLSGLANSTTYYWQVRAYNGSSYAYANGGAWWSFTTVAQTPPGAFSKLEPADGAASQPLAPTLVWEQSTGATGYSYCYDTSDNGACDSAWISTGTATAEALSSLNPGTTYYWQARALNDSGTTPANGGVWSSFTTLAPSNNDDFLDATLIGSLPYDNPGRQDTRNATSDLTDPDFPCGGGGKKSHTVWFKYTAAGTEIFYVDTGGSDYDTVLAVWTGTEGSLVNVACNDDFNGLQSQVAVNGSSGTTYYIEVVSYNPEGAGWLDLRVSTTVPVPGTDSFAGAVMITLPHLSRMNVEGATTDASDPVLPCGPASQAYKSVWFRHTPSNSGQAVLSTYTSGYDTVLAVWTGTEGNLTSIACNNDSRGSTSLLQLDLDADLTYYIEVVQFSDITPADYWLSLNLVRVGDDFDVPLVLDPSLPSTAMLNTAEYSYFYDDPDFTACNVMGTNSVWYKLIPSESGRLNVNTVGSNYDTVIGVWSGDRGGALTSLGCNDNNAGNNLSDLSVPISAGNTYYIEVASWWGTLDGGASQNGKSADAGGHDSAAKAFNDVKAEPSGSLTLNVSFEGVKVYIGGLLRGNYHLNPGSGIRRSYPGIDGGPVQIKNTDPDSILAAERVIYRIQGLPVSFSELMALPDSQLDTTYWLPWYNNKDLNTQLRFGNVSGTDATVHVFIAGVEVTGSPYTLTPGQSIRRFYAGIDNGPVKIESDVPIVAAERVIYNVNGTAVSFSELMALPDSQLDTTYWLPWYNNKDLNTQLRFGNVSGTDATVHVFIGGVEVTGSPYTLTPGQSIRRFYNGIDNGPVKIESDVPIVAAERVIYNAAGGADTSFSEMMALPAGQLDTTYWLPWYNNKALNTQLRFGNVSGTDATVHVFIGGVEVTGSPYTLAPGQSIRRSYPGIDTGPVKIESDVPIVAAERVIYKVNGVDTSFSELMALPDSQLDTIYWLPWYNNTDLDSQLRFGVP